MTAMGAVVTAIVRLAHDGEWALARLMLHALATAGEYSR